MSTESIRPGNRYTFYCGVTQENTLYVGCVLKRHRFWRGQNINNPVCAAAMRCGGCPAVRMFNLELKNDTAIFHSEDPKPRRLPERILGDVRRIVFYNGSMIGVSPADVERLTSKLDWGAVGPDEKPKRLVSRSAMRSGELHNQPDRDDDSLDDMPASRGRVSKTWTATPTYSEPEELKQSRPVSSGFAQNIETNIADALNEASAS